MALVKTQQADLAEQSNRRGRLFPGRPDSEVDRFEIGTQHGKRKRPSQRDDLPKFAERGGIMKRHRESTGNVKAAIHQKALVQNIDPIAERDECPGMRSGFVISRHRRPLDEPDHGAEDGQNETWNRELGVLDPSAH
jgi:hypothetical protein